MILNDLFLEINQVFTRAYCARDGARPCRLRPLRCDWLLPKRRDIIRLLGNKEKWLSSWIESPNKGIFRCRESVFFILQIVFFLIPFYQFFINPRIFTRPCTVPDDQVIRVTLAQSHMALRLDCGQIWSAMERKMKITDVSIDFLKIKPFPSFSPIMSVECLTKTHWGVETNLLFCSAKHLLVSCLPHLSG